MDAPWWVGCALALCSCGAPGSVKVSVGNDGAEIDTTASALRAYVQGGAYRTWDSEPAIHAATLTSPHGRVRVFFNQKAVGALRAGTASLPPGAMVVKELYPSTGAERSGFAAMVKTSEKSWTWWEGLGANLDNAAYGADIDLCRGCHSGAGNRDQVLSPPP